MEIKIKSEMGSFREKYGAIFKSIPQSTAAQKKLLKAKDQAKYN
jgi:hypothetical protein